MRLPLSENANWGQREDDRERSAEASQAYLDTSSPTECAPGPFVARGTPSAPHDYAAMSFVCLNTSLEGVGIYGRIDIQWFHPQTAKWYGIPGVSTFCQADFTVRPNGGIAWGPLGAWVCRYDYQYETDDPYLKYWHRAQVRLYTPVVRTLYSDPWVPMCHPDSETNICV